MWCASADGESKFQLGGPDRSPLCGLASSGGRQLVTVGKDSAPRLTVRIIQRENSRLLNEDESVPRRLAGSFPGSFTVCTVQEMGWAGTENGRLLLLAASQQFEVLLSTVANGVNDSGPTTPPRSTPAWP